MTVPAGESAAFEFERQRLLALHHARLSVIAHDMARRFAEPASTESRLASTLQPLESRGYTILAHRRSARSRRAQVDLIVAGPGGIFIIDATTWRGARLVEGRIFRGAVDVTDEFAATADLAESTRSALASLGIAPGEIHALTVFADQPGLPSTDLFGVTLLGEAEAVTGISGRGIRLSPERIAASLVALDHYFPEQPIDTSLQLDVSRPVPIHYPAPELAAEQIQAALVEGATARPIEEWMAGLHPEQANLVRRTFTGPSRIRGAAGTGKTVVGLHRAAYLARSGQGRVLVTTFVRTLPDVLASMLERMAPDVADRVDFRGVYGFALDVLKSRGIPTNLRPEEAKKIFDRLWEHEGKSGPLGAIDQSKKYWEDEVDHVIKGRGLTRFLDYAPLARPGRRRRLTMDQRRTVWDFYMAYQRALDIARIQDYGDIVLAAEASLRAVPHTGFSSVIVDEAQDLSCVMLRMLHSLVGDRPDGLTLIGDDQQAIYPGGFSLAEAGVSIAGRGVVMSTNYRNTSEIVAFAQTMVAGDEFFDIEGAKGVPDVVTEIDRHGELPTMKRFTSQTEHDRSLVQHVQHIAALPGMEFGDIGVLALKTWEVLAAVKALQLAGIPTVDLAKYNGRPINAVKVGTIYRAKGLEFKQVVVARAPRALLDPEVRRIDPGSRERRELDRRALYVAMTRARDGLWVGVA